MLEEEGAVVCMGQGWKDLNVVDEGKQCITI